MKQQIIRNQQVRWNQDTNECFLETEYDDGSISSEKITSEQAAQWTAENKY